MESNLYRVMVVEDSETQLMMFRHVLEKQGWEVIWASSAEAALEKLSRTVPDIIIIDFHLPGIQGDELCRRLKMNIDTRSIPILMLTVEDGDESEKRGLDSGADDYLPKYTDIDILLLRIKSLVRKSVGGRAIPVGRVSTFPRGRILVVDENQDYLKYLVQAFSEDGILIDIASNDNEVLGKISSVAYDCVLVDMVIPGSGKSDVLKKILDLRRSHREPLVVLLLNGHESKDDITHALEAGADDFVDKSNDISIIKARLFALLRRKFIQQDNQRFFEELKQKELEVERVRIEKEAAESKVLLAEKLEHTVAELEREVDERKRMEVQIKEYSLELERSNQELESFAYIASHDLQEPLRAITNYLQLVEKRYQPMLDDKGRDFIDRAVKGAKRMQEMINDLLTYSRVTSDSHLLDWVSIDDIIDRALVNLGVAMEKNRIQVTRDPMPGLECCESQILRLFQNLLSNAIKFSDTNKPQPIIHLSALYQPQEHNWLFSVRDNGIGILPEYHEQIFKIFYRLHNRNKYPGTGIGLAICQKIVEQHGGRIWVESVPGHYSIFNFTLQVRDKNHE